MSYWIDTHAHIYLPDFDGDRSEVISRCIESGVKKIAMPNIDHATIDALLETTNQYSDLCYPMMGLHPCSVKSDFEKQLHVVESWLSKRKFLAIGEIGIDLYWDKTFWQQQVEAFKVQVSWAKKFNLPVVIHCRESLDQTIELLRPLANQKLKGIFHCFTGSVEQAKSITEMGFHLGIGGVVTFKNGGLDKVIDKIPIDKIVLETDSPYLAPVPHRGKRNSPEFIPEIAERICSLLQMDVMTFQKRALSNTMTVFNFDEIAK